MKKHKKLFSAAVGMAAALTLLIGNTANAMSYSEANILSGANGAYLKNSGVDYKIVTDVSKHTFLGVEIDGVAVPNEYLKLDGATFEGFGTEDEAEAVTSSPAASPAPAVTATPAPTATPGTVPSPSVTPAPTATPSTVPSPTATPSAVPSPSVTPASTATPTPTPSAPATTSEPEPTPVEPTAVPSESPAPATTEEPSTSDAPATTEEPSTSDAPATTEEPSTSYAPATTEEPSTSNAPATTEEPSTSYAPVASDEPSTSYEPAASEEPSTSYEPAASEEPSTSYEPATYSTKGVKGLFGSLLDLFAPLTVHAANDNTQLEISAAYLDTLSEGNHVVKLNYLAGSITTSMLTTSDPALAATASPKTADNTNLVPYVLLAAGSVGAIVFFGRKRKENVQ